MLGRSALLLFWCRSIFSHNKSLRIEIALLLALKAVPAGVRCGPKIATYANTEKSAPVMRAAPA